MLSGAGVDEIGDDDLWFELGLGRPRVLSAWGRDDAAERWWEGDAGPDSAIAKAATGQCADCAFWVRLTGGLGSVFGACGNAMAPDDGRVTALAHGCGAHSEAVAEIPARWADLGQEEAFEVVSLPSDTSSYVDESPVAEAVDAEVVAESASEEAAVVEETTVEEPSDETPVEVVDEPADVPADEPFGSS